MRVRPIFGFSQVNDRQRALKLVLGALELLSGCNVRQTDEPGRWGRRQGVNPQVESPECKRGSYGELPWPPAWPVTRPNRCGCRPGMIICWPVIGLEDVAG